VWAGRDLVAMGDAAGDPRAALRGLAGLLDLRTALAVPGARVDEVDGVPFASVGSRDASHHVLVLGGLHAGELLGCWAALAVVSAELPDDVCLHVMPAVDHAGVGANARKALASGGFEGLLGLESRDLESELWRGARETEALRDWLAKLPAVDAFFSFHAADCLSGGAFFYVEGDGVMDAGLMEALRTSLGRCDVPLLPVDPTPVPSTTVAPGFFALEAPGDGAFGYVVDRFRPRVAMVSEIPVGLVDGVGRSAEAYGAMTREVRADLRRGVARSDVRWVQPAVHVDCLVGGVVQVARWLSRRSQPRRH